MFQLTYTYKTSNFDFSFTMNHPINNNEIIHYLISNGYFCIAQCPNDLSLLFEEFPFEEIHQTLIQVSNFNFSSSMTKTQLIECLIKNHFPQGISTYSKTQMNQLIVLFNQYSNSICKSRKHCSKLIRNSNELVCNGRGSYIHVNNIQRTCFLNQKTVSKLLTEFNKVSTTFWVWGPSTSSGGELIIPSS